MLLGAVFSIVTIFAAIYTLFELKMLVGYCRAERLNKLRHTAPDRAQGTRPIPTVTLQLPIFNEGAVALNLIRAVNDIDYPRDRLLVQVLDDSDDDTPQIVAAEIARLQALGLDIRHLRRGSREGWKAGAMAWGLTQSTSEFVVIFDADFVPPRDYLRRVLIDDDVFNDPSVAFLQGRWTYVNEHQNILTRAQALLINRHFMIQKPYQVASGRTTVFNGSAGIWRRSAIDAVGGWSADTLCEDLDLSYRCALVGLKGAYEKSLTCPSEIPATLSAFKLQQRRWAKGSAQCMRKLVGGVLRADHLRDRWDDLYNITGYVVHPILLVYTLLLPWVLLQQRSYIIAFGGICLLAANVIALSGFVLTTVVSRRRFDFRAAQDVVFALSLGMSLMVNNTVAFVVGCFEQCSIFERTPKGKMLRAGAKSERRSLDWNLKFEVLFSLYMLAMFAILYTVELGMQAIPCLVLGMAMMAMAAFQMKENNVQASAPAPAFG